MIDLLVTDKDGQISGYAFNGDSFEVFETFFGTINPDVVALDQTGKQVKLLEKIESDLHKDAITERKDLYTKDLEITCECTLEEFHEGSIKEVGFVKIVLNEASGKTSPV